MTQPWVTAIMPTRERPAWAREALAYFQRQTYPCRELVILDDADDPSFNRDPVLPDVHYLRMAYRQPIGRKRNLCCLQATGDVIVHWDSDDWSSPDRIADQVGRLESSGKAVTGYYAMPFYDEAHGQWWFYDGHPAYVVGSSLAYWRDWWAGHAFNEDVTVEEDNPFIRDAHRAGELATAPAAGRMAARIHSGNTARKVLTAPYRPGPACPGAFVL